MTYIKKIAIATAIITISTSAFASTGTTTVVTPEATVTTSASLEMSEAPKLVSKTSKSVTLEWSKNQAAVSYVVKYGKTSVADSQEENAMYDDETDPVISTGTTIEWLEANTDYYFSVVALDKDSNESDTYSDELMVKTDAEWTTSTGVAATTGLSLVSVNAVDNKTVSVEFSSALSSDPITFKITKTQDNSDVPVSSVQPDATSPNKVNVTVATQLDPKSSYSITVISAKDTAWNNIQEGINGVKEFLTAENLPVNPELAALNAAASSTGATMSGATTESGSLAPTELPATGTKENLIIISSLLIALGLVYAYRRKLAK